jgi:Undecaprenyl-phosphate glucose phosphotransferase
VLRERHRFFRSVLIVADTTLVAVSTVAAYLIRFDLLGDLRAAPPGEVITYSTHAIPVTTAVPIVLTGMLWAGLYRPRRDQRFEREARDIVKAVAIGVVATFAFISFFGRMLFNDLDPSRLQYVVWAAVMTVALVGWRLSFRTGLRFIRRRGWNLRHVAIIGTGRLGQVVGRTLRRNSWTGINPVIYISHHATTTRQTCLDVPVAGGLDDLEKLLEGRDLSGVFVALPGRMTAALPSLIARLQRFSLDVRVVPDMNPRFLPVNMAVSELDGMPVLSVRQSPLEGWGGVLKRGFDIAGALGGLALFAIPMAAIALLVRASGPGPVVFRQERMSLNGQRFQIFKFRTMAHVDAEAQALRDAGRGTDAWTRKDDPRVTRIGRILRRTSMDELPQLFNVLLGEMSLVGPRPERPELILRFREDWRGYMLRQHVKAGMTGWAQVNGFRGDTSLRKRLQYDLFYIRNWSLMFDLRILWMTLFRGFAHPNAR